jgi:hypothetical protein
MATLDLLASAVHHIGVSDLTPRAAGADSAAVHIQPVMVIVVFLAVLLVGGALKQLGRAFAPIGELLRLVLSALAVAILLITAVVVLIGGLVLSARGS